MTTSNPDDIPEPKGPSGKGIILRCTWCRTEQRLDVGHAYPQRASASLFLHLMTGGWSGEAPFAFKKTSSDDPINPLVETQLGDSKCCKKQLEGELYGYAEEGR